MSKILITGGTGLVGSHLSKLLISKGHSVVFLSRKSGVKNGIKLYQWNPQKEEIDLAAFEGVDHIINLAGAGVADKRWTRKYKQEIYDSRVLATQFLAKTIKEQGVKLQSFISTSAIGIYGNNVPNATNEEGKIGDNFLARVCNDWEKATDAIMDIGIRTVIVRVGVVLAKEAGFIPEVLKPINYYIGAPLGSGKQLVSWIHIEDLCSVFISAIENTHMMGAYNAVTPIAISNIELTKKMAKAVGKPILLPPIPVLMLQLLFGELSSTLIANQNIAPQKLLNLGFKYSYPHIEDALKNLL